MDAKVNIGYICREVGPGWTLDSIIKAELRTDVHFRLSMATAIQLSMRNPNYMMQIQSKIRNVTIKLSGDCLNLVAYKIQFCQNSILRANALLSTGGLLMLWLMRRLRQPNATSSKAMVYKQIVIQKSKLPF